MGTLNALLYFNLTSFPTKSSDRNAKDYWFSNRTNTFAFFCLLISGISTLWSVYFYFNYYLTRAYKFINPHFEKPGQVHFHQWPIPTCLSRRLRQWEIENEESSLMQVRFAAKPKNPE